MPPAHLPHWLIQALKYGAGLGVTALLAWLFVRDIDLREVWRTMRGANLLLLAPVAAAFLLSYWLQAWRWHHLVRHLRDVSTGAAFPRVLLAHSAGMLLPFQLGQVLMVQISAEKFELDRSRLAGAEFVSRLMDGLVFALFLVVGLALLPIGSAFVGLTIFMLVGTLTGLALAFWASHEHPHVLERNKDLPFHSVIVTVHEQVLHRFLRGVSSVRNLGQTRDVFLLSVAIWAIEAVFYWLTGLMLHLHARPAVYIFLVAAANIGGGIPFAQSGAGFVYVSRQAFVAVGQRPAVAAAYALTLQALLIAPIVVIAPYAIIRMHLGWDDLVPWLKRVEPAQEDEATPRCSPPPERRSAPQTGPGRPTRPRT
ncbi:MAG TPA: lysylphosphatidylglycerol synthase transmembrane domain-containing protein [Dehalococcoidia bacterium]|nr:lysylphosphatidylglycerol synthase transmembrane domain-containing protein [Dehalococcoidia bacterium]